MKLTTFVLISAIQPGSAITVSYTDGTWSNAGGSGTPTADFSASPYIKIAKVPSCPVLR